MDPVNEWPNPPGAEPESYIGLKICGCIAMAMVLDDASRRDVAKAIGQAIRDGYRIEPSTNAGVRERQWKCFDHRKAQGRLFAGT